VGYQAGYTTATGDSNTFVGEDAGYSTVGNRNTFVGREAGRASNLASTQQNTFVGTFSGRYVTSGAKNTIIGGYDGNQGSLDIRTSSNNIVLSDGDGNYHIHINSAGKKVMRGSGTTADGIDAGSQSGFYFGNAGDQYSSRATSSNSIHFRFFNTNGQVGNIATNGSATVYNTSSDYRLKENVDYTWDATTRLKQLKPARFNFIADDTNTTVDGFLAHEVSSIVPEAITGEKDAVKVWDEADELPDGVSAGDSKLDADGNTMLEYQSIDQSKLVPLLVKAIQELEARLAVLEG